MRKIVIVTGLLILGNCAHAQCRTPSYRTGVVLTDSPDLVMTISIRLEDFTPEKLICLTKELKERYPGRTTIVANIFSSHWAAKHSIGVLPPESEKKDFEALAQKHGEYFFDAAKREEYVEIIPQPLPSGQGSCETKIELPAKGVPRCNLELDGRCVTALDEVSYPRGQQLSGDVILTGAVDRDGRMRRVHAAAPSATPAIATAALEDAALANLKSWRLEPAGRESTVRITYSYRLVKSGSSVAGKTEAVRFELPNRVVISGNGIR